MEEGALLRVAVMGAVKRAMAVSRRVTATALVVVTGVDAKGVVILHVMADLGIATLVDAHVLAIAEMIALVNLIGDQRQRPQLTHRSRPAAAVVPRIVRAVAEGVVVGAALGAAIRVIGLVIQDVKKPVIPNVTLDVLMGA